jgi:hypothetical protein
VDVGDADGDHFGEQVSSAIAFLERHENVLKGFSSNLGFKSGAMDFGVWNMAPDIVARSYTFPPLLVKLAAECNLTLTVTVYAASDS